MKILSQHISKNVLLTPLFVLSLTCNQSMATMQEKLEVDDSLLEKSSRSYVDFSKIDDADLVDYYVTNKTHLPQDQMENEIIPNVIFGLVDYGKYETAAKILFFHIKNTQGNISQNLKDFLSEYSIKWKIEDSEELLIERMKKKLK